MVKLFSYTLLCINHLRKKFNHVRLEAVFTLNYQNTLISVFEYKKKKKENLHLQEKNNFFTLCKFNKILYIKN